MSQPQGLQSVKRAYDREDEGIKLCELNGATRADKARGKERECTYSEFQGTQSQEHLQYLLFSLVELDSYRERQHPQGDV
jgi:hypothetical protein